MKVEKLSEIISKQKEFRDIISKVEKELNKQKTIIMGQLNESDELLDEKLSDVNYQLFNEINEMKNAIRNNNDINTISNSNFTYENKNEFKFPENKSNNEDSLKNQPNLGINKLKLDNEIDYKCNLNKENDYDKKSTFKKKRITKSDTNVKNIINSLY